MGIDIVSTIDVAGAARKAGFDGADLVTAVAVALAESAGHCRAHNTNAATGDNSYGLWQINMIGALGPARRHEFGIATNDALFDPATNAAAAFTIYQDAHNRFTDWSTFQNNAHRAHLDAAAAAVTQLRKVDGHGQGRILTRLLQIAHPMMHGDDVHDCQVVVGAAADGLFGTVTRGLVVGWQHAHGLLADGIVGPRTAASFGWRFQG